jgi:hypothetical protein
MDFADKKLEIGIAVLAIVATAGLLKVFGSFGSGPGIFSQEVSYAMPRPKNDIVGEFGLNGREIDRRYVNPFEKKKAEAKAAAAAEAAKANQTVKKAPVAKAAAKKADAKKAPEVKVDVVDRDPSKKHSGESYGGTESKLIGVTGGPLAAEGADKKKEEEKLSPAQWRALMSAQPTRENMDKLVQALASNKVDANTFYSIIEEMLMSQKTDDQALALYGVQRTNNVRSFAVVALHISTLQGETQTAANTFLRSYSAPSKHGILIQALQSDDITVAMEAAEVVQYGLQVAQNGGSTDPRDVRDENQTQSMASYGRFRSVFEAWAQDGDAALQSLAATILPLLPTTQASM